MSSSKCYKCNRMGHFARECPMGSGPGPRGRGGPREKCYKCNRPGHFARDCKEEEDHCYRCDGVGHIAKDCEHSSDEPSCYNCSKMGHIARDCPEPERTCYVCNKSGHISRQCTENKSENRNAKCYVCGKIGHISRECPIGDKQENEKRCYVCGAGGHISRDCPQGESDTTCYRPPGMMNQRMGPGSNFGIQRTFVNNDMMLWKPLQDLVHEKKMLLENDLKAEIQQLERRLSAVKQEYESERISRQLLEQNMQSPSMGNAGGGGGGFQGGGNFSGGMPGMQNSRFGDHCNGMRDVQFQQPNNQPPRQREFWELPEDGPNNFQNQGGKRGAGWNAQEFNMKRQRN